MSNNQKTALIAAIGFVSVTVVGAMCYTIPKLVNTILHN